MTHDAAFSACEIAAVSGDATGRIPDLQSVGYRVTDVSSSRNLAGEVQASPALFRKKAAPAAAVWTRQAEAALLDFYVECDGDFRKIAPKLRRGVEECRTRHRQLMMLKPRAVEVERKCLFCLRVRKIAKPMRICDGCKDTEEWQHARALA